MIALRFEALQDFFAEELQSQYCAGLQYTVRPGDTVLASLVDSWQSEGKVRVLKDEGAQISGG